MKRTLVAVRGGLTHYRVVVDGYTYRIEDIYDGHAPDVHPFVQHEPSIVSAGSVAELKAVLQKLLVACDQPVLCLLPEKLVVSPEKYE